MKEEESAKQQEKEEVNNITNMIINKITLTIDEGGGVCQAAR